MFFIYNHLSQIQYTGLMAVYEETNFSTGADMYPGKDRFAARMLAEQNFYQYLQQVFFQTPGARYAVWQQNGTYVSALRLEPYKDGLLIAGVETAPDHRRRGYARLLLSETISHFSNITLYSHIEKGNTASIALHEGCGFKQISLSAVYIDGTVSDNAFTYCYSPRV